MRLIFIRHAEPDYEKDSLTKKGWHEAALLAERTAGWKVDEFYCSPLGRARDTASLTLQACGREAVTCDWLREFHAPVLDPETGKRRIPWDLLPGYWTKIPEMHSCETFADTQLMRSGNVKEEYERVCAGLDGILAAHGYVRDGKLYRTGGYGGRPAAEACEFGGENEETLVFFCHMGVTLVLLSHLLNISPVNLLHGICLLPSSVTIVSAEERREGEAYFRCQTMGDTAHLYTAGEQPSHMAYFAEVMEEHAAKTRQDEEGMADGKEKI